MAIGTTDIGIVGGATYDGLYKEMGKGNASTNYSLYAARGGVNDIDIGNYANANNDPTLMSYWQNYDHMSLQFRYNTNQTFDHDTYADNSPYYFDPTVAGIVGTFSATQGTNWWEFDGSSDNAQFAATGSGDAYKVNPSGNGVIAFWFLPQDNSAGQTDVLVTDGPDGTISSYRGYRFALNGSTMRIIRGDGGGTSSSNRRTFASTDFIVQEEWNFLAFQGAYNNQTRNTSNNYIWLWNQSNGWSNGISFLSGTGGNLGFSTSDGMAISGGGNGGRHYQGYIGGIYAFNQTMAQGDIESLKDNTQATYGI